MLGEHWLLESFIFWKLGCRIGGLSAEVIVCRASCNKAVGSRSCMQGRLEPFDNLAGLSLYSSCFGCPFGDYTFWVDSL